MAFIIYAALFRLSVIAAGTACVYMGYRLFVLGVMPRDGSQIDAQAGEIRLSLKNAAPGTIFALFGAVIIGLMLWQGNPQADETIKTAATDAGGGTTTVTRTASLRGGAEFEVGLTTAHALAAAGQHDDAIRAFGRLLADPTLSLDDAAGPMFGIADAMLSAGRADEAHTYASIVQTVRPESAEVYHLIARIQEARGQRQNALRAMERAASLDNAYAGALELMQQGE